MNPRHPAVRVLLGVLAIVAAASAGWWASRETLLPVSASSGPTTAPVMATVTTASVGRSIHLTATATQPVRALARNALTGVVTATAPGEKRTGDTIYAVAGVPVRVVQGTLPFYRDLGPGVVGADVGQFERALKALGYLETADSMYGSATTAAVQKWQKALGLPPTGRVGQGELVAVPTLPTRLTLGPLITLGAVLTGGEESVVGVSGPRRFELLLGEDQARLVPADGKVVVHYKEAAWQAIIAESTAQESGTTSFTLTAADGGPVCGSQCADLPPDPVLSLSADLALTPEVTGPAVPAAAVLTTSDGSTSVVMADGSKRQVVVKGSGAGVLVVTGLTSGERVRVTDGSPPTAAP